MTGIVNYGAGNLGSVANALARLKIDARFVRGPEELSTASSPYEKIIFPGDGHFESAMKMLNESGYTEALRTWINADKPFFGICIGLQLLLESSEEAPPGPSGACEGLSVIKGTVKLFPGRKVPQMGWNETEYKPGSRLFKGFSGTPFFYYIHSYYADPEDKDCIAATSEYYTRFTAAVERGALCAVQFHPEKSGTDGLRLLANALQA